MEQCLNYTLTRKNFKNFGKNNQNILLILLVAVNSRGKGKLQMNKQIREEVLRNQDTS